MKVFHGVRPNRLYLDGVIDRLDNAGKFHQQAVTGTANDAPAMARAYRIGDRPMLLEPLERALLIASHQPAVAGNVDGNDGGKPALRL